MNRIRSLKVLKHRNTEDLFALSQGYFPLLEQEEIVLFINLFAQAKVNTLVRCEEYDYSRFLRNYNLTYQEAEEGMARLEELNLISITDNQGSRIVKFEKVRPLGELMKDERFHSELREGLSEEKYDELVFMTGEELETVGGRASINKAFYISFYSGVMELLGGEFSMSQETLDLIGSSEEHIPVEVLHRFAQMCAIKRDGKYHLSHKHMEFLIRQRISDGHHTFNLDKHQEFWRKLHHSTSGELGSKFDELFGHHEPGEMYRLLTSKERAPDSLTKCLRSIVQEHQFQFPIINALLSFVMCLLGKIPTKYLLKVSETLNRDYSANKIGVIKLARGVIESDLKNGRNRLNVDVDGVERTVTARETHIRSPQGEKTKEMKEVFEMAPYSFLYSG